MSVLVLGGGPAGAAAALTVLAAGVAVTIVDRSPFPRYRPGETLHPGIEPLLERLGSRRSVLDAGYLRHAGHWVDWAGTRGFVRFGGDARGAWRGFQAPRADFDQRLLTAAARNGAAVRLGLALQSARVEGDRVVGVDTRQGPLHARLTIDCTGGAHWLSRQLGMRPRYRSPRLVARFGYVTGRVSARARLPLMRADARGWTWICEVERGRFHWTRVTRPGERPPTRWVPGVLRDATPGPSYGADVTWRIARRTAGPGWFLAGDAAAVVDPSSSHGVLRAIMTGMMAGHLAAKALGRQAGEAECADAYHAWLSAWFDDDTARLTQAYRAAGLTRLT